MAVRTPYPRTLPDFQRAFPDDAACARYLVERRWPDGFVCPRCGSSDVSLIATRGLWQCRPQRHQTSITAGTVLHRTKLPLTTWFWAAYLAATLTPGISAVQLRQQLGIKRYETAWMLLHKLRRAMVNPNRERLSGEVEVDETWIGGRQAGFKRGRSTQDRNALLVAIAVERREKSLGRLRMEVIPDAAGSTLSAFVLRTIAPGSTIHSDAWPGYASLTARGYKHLPKSQRALKKAGLDANVVPGVHRVISNLKSWLQGTHHGVGADHLDNYLDEYVFRFNRRFYKMAGFETLLGLSTSQAPTTWELLRGPLPDDDVPRRRGKATGLTRLKRAADPVTSLEAGTS